MLLLQTAQEEEMTQLILWGFVAIVGVYVLYLIALGIHWVIKGDDHKEIG